MSENGAVTPGRHEEEQLQDPELLRRYVESGSEPAFTQLVRRRIDLVYSVALRQTGGDRHRAEDATQAVFTDLARKAGALARRPVLVGWLYRSARFAAAGLVRSERRRQTREKEAHTMQSVLDQPHDAEWQQVRPVLDEILSEIDERDRDAILLRFFDGLPFAEIGSRLRLNENAARMRVERALDQLSAALAKRGIKSSTAALGAVLGGQIAGATPAGLASAVAGVALAQAAPTASGSLVALVGLSKLQAGIAGVVTVACATGYIWQQQTNAALQTELAALNQQRQQLTVLRVENDRLTATLAEIELLRRDDAQFTELAQKVSDAKKAVEERARLARVREAQRATEGNVQAEIDRMNREGNALVGQYKALVAKTKDQSLAATDRMLADKEAKLKLTEIQAKQREIQTFIAATRGTAPPVFKAVDGSRYVSVADQNSVEGRVAQAGELVSLRLPKADQATVVSALEQIGGFRITRDPSLTHVRGTLDLETPPVTRIEAANALRSALRDQLNIVIESNPDGSLTAKVKPAH